MNKNKIKFFFDTAKTDGIKQLLYGCINKIKLFLNKELILMKVKRQLGLYKKWIALGKTAGTIQNMLPEKGIGLSVLSFILIFGENNYFTYWCVLASIVIGLLKTL